MRAIKVSLQRFPRVEERILGDLAKMEDGPGDPIRAGNELFVNVVTLAPNPT